MTTRPRRRISLNALYLVLATGCQPTAVPTQSPPPSNSAASPPLHQRRQATDRQFDFGSVIGKPGERPSHTYIITNTTSHRILIQRSINSKPCCGVVEQITPTALEPGQSKPFAVTLLVGNRIGPLQHRAIIETDQKGEPLWEYLTSAMVFPEIRVAERTPDSALKEKGPHTQKHFTAFALGTKAQPPATLDEATVPPGWNFFWDGPAEIKPHVSDVNLVELSRPFTVARLPSAKMDEGVVIVSLHRDGEILLNHPISWRSIKPIQANPRAIFVSQSESQVEFKAILRATDDREFSVLETRPTLSGVVAEAEAGTKSIHHIRIRVERTTENSGRGGEIAIPTNHPEHPTVVIPIYISRAFSN